MSNGASYTFNAQNQATYMSLPDKSNTALTYGTAGEGQITAAGTASYQYDILGHVASMTTNGTTSYFTSTPGGQVLEETVSAAAYAYLHDGFGSVVAVVDNAGLVQDSYAYDPFGNQIATHGWVEQPTPSNSVSNPYNYQGTMNIVQDPTAWAWARPGWFHNLTGTGTQLGNYGPGQDLSAPQPWSCSLTEWFPCLP